MTAHVTYFFLITALRGGSIIVNGRGIFTARRARSATAATASRLTDLF